MSAALAAAATKNIPNIASIFLTMMSHPNRNSLARRAAHFCDISITSKVFHVSRRMILQNDNARPLAGHCNVVILLVDQFVK
jgi:hypothetical protein